MPRLKFHKRIVYEENYPWLVVPGRMSIASGEIVVNGHERRVVINTFSKQSCVLTTLAMSPAQTRELGRVLIEAADAVDPEPTGQGLDALIGGVRITGVDRLRKVVHVERVGPAPGVVVIPGIADDEDDWRVEEN